MARRFKKARRYVSRAYAKVKRYAKRSKGLSPMEAAAGSAIYGAIRNPLVNAVPDIARFGAYSDNVVLGGLAALAAWKGKGMTKKAGMVVLSNESFVASTRASQGISSSNSGSIYIN